MCMLDVRTASAGNAGLILQVEQVQPVSDHMPAAQVRQQPSCGLQPLLDFSTHTDA